MANTNLPDDTLEEDITEIELLCEQRQYERARSLAQQLLRAYPSSARVHEAMGDVAAGRRNHAEAIQWYELALQLGFHQRVMDSLEEQRRLLQESRRPVPDAEEAEEGAVTGRHYKLIAAIAGAAVLLILALFLIFAGRGSKPSGTEGAPSRPRAVSSREAVRSQPEAPTGAAPSSRAERAAPSGPTRRPSAEYPPSGTAAQQPTQQGLPPVYVTREIGAPLSDQDRLLLKALASLNWPDGTSLSGDINAMVDPFTGYTFITLMLPQSLKQSAQFSTTLVVSYQVAVAAMKRDTSLRSLTVRVIAPVSTKDTQTVLTIFRGNTNRTALERYLEMEKIPSTEEIWNQVFATTWWNPSVPVENPFD